MTSTQGYHRNYDFDLYDVPYKYNYLKLNHYALNYPSSLRYDLFIMSKCFLSLVKVLIRVRLSNVGYFTKVGWSVRSL